MTCLSITRASRCPIIRDASTNPAALICSAMLRATFATPTHPNTIRKPIITNMLLLTVTASMMRNGRAGNAYTTSLALIIASSVSLPLYPA